MYQVTNQTTNTTKTFKNKDLVYQYLDRENARCKHQKVECLIVVERYDKKKTILEVEDIYLPFDGVADALFLQKEAPKPEATQKRGAFFNRSKASNDQIPVKKDKQDLRMAVSDTPKWEKTKKRSEKSASQKLSTQKRLLVMTLLSLCLGGAACGLSYINQTRSSHLARQVRTLSDLQTVTPKLDTFCRHAIPYLYQDDSDLSAFTSGSLKLSHQTGTVQAVILNDIKKAKAGYQVTYVVTTKTGDRLSEQLLILTIAQKKNSSYGYVITQAPQVSTYSN